MTAEPSEITQPLPDPPRSTGNSLIEGLSGAWNKTKAVVGDTTKRLSENPHVQKIGEVTKKGYEKTKEGVIVAGTKVGEVTKKGWDKANENEKFAAGVDKVKDTSGKAWDKTKEVAGPAYEKTKRVSTDALEKSKAGLAVAGDKLGTIKGQVGEKVGPAWEKTKTAVGGAKKKGSEIWEAGGGAIVRIKEKVDDIRWGGDAKTVLLQREDSFKKWREIRIRGAEEITVAARKEYTTNYFVEKGTMVKWSFRVKDLDVGFGVRIRVMQDGGSVEQDILGVEKFDATDTIEGSWTADEDRTIVLVFDNSKSLLRQKTVCYLVGVIPPEKGAEGENPFAEEPSSSSSPAAAVPPPPPPAVAEDDLSNLQNMRLDDGEEKAEI